MQKVLELGSDSLCTAESYKNEVSFWLGAFHAVLGTSGAECSVHATLFDATARFVWDSQRPPKKNRFVFSWSYHAVLFYIFTPQFGASKMNTSCFLLASLGQDNPRSWTWTVSANWMHQIPTDSFTYRWAMTHWSQTHACQYEKPQASNYYCSRCWVTWKPYGSRQSCPSMLSSSTAPSDLGRKAVARFIF